MLKHLQPELSLHLQAALNSFNLLCRRWPSTLATVLIIALVLSLPALFWIFTDNLEKISKNWQSGRISLYLKPSLSTMEEEACLKQIETMVEIEKITFKTKEQNLAALKHQEGLSEVLQHLPANPLPSMVELIPKSNLNTANKLQSLINRLKALPQVDQVKLDLDWIHRLHSIIAFLSHLIQAIVGLLALAVILIIANSLSLIIQDKREEIQVLKLIGADDSFIFRPFLYSGIWYGLAGAILAILMVNLSMLSLAPSTEELVNAYRMPYLLLSLNVSQAYSIVLIAIFLGWLGAYFSVKKLTHESLFNKNVIE